MKKESQWTIKKKIGDAVEEYIFNCFKKHFNAKITDYANNPNYYHNGDFLINGKWLDSKSDAHIALYHNILIELRIKRYGKWFDGWGTKAKYDYIAFYCEPEKRTYLIDFNLVKKMIAEGKTRKPIETYNKNECATIEYILIPLKQCLNEGALVATWEKTDEELVTNYKKYKKAV